MYFWKFKNLTFFEKPHSPLRFKSTPARPYSPSGAAESPLRRLVGGPNGGPGQRTRSRENVCPYVFHVSHRRKCVFVSRVARFFTFLIEGRVTCWCQQTRKTQNLEAPVKEHEAGRTCVFHAFHVSHSRKGDSEAPKTKKNAKRAPPSHPCFGLWISRSLRVSRFS